MVAVYGIEKKKTAVSLPMAAHQSLCVLAKQSGQTPAQYIRSLVMRHLAEQGLPLYCSEDVPIATSPSDSVGG